MRDAYYDDSGNQAGVRAVLLTVLRWASALLSLALIAVIVLWAYRLGVRDAREIPVVRALDTPARTQPTDPGGAQAAHQGLEVNNVLAGDADRADAPAPVATAPSPSLTEEDTSPAQAETAQATPQTAPETDPLAAAIDAAIAQVGAEDAVDGAARLDTSIRPQSRPQGSGPAVTDPVPQPAQQDATNSAEAAEVAAISPQATTPPAPATTTGAGRRYQVFPGAQLVQFNVFASEADAIAEWEALTASHGDLLGDKRRYVEPVNSGNRVFYRLRAVGFLQASETEALCTALKARGVDCIPTVQR